MPTGHFLGPSVQLKVPDLLEQPQIVNRVPGYLNEFRMKGYFVLRRIVQVVLAAVVERDQAAVKAIRVLCCDHGS